MINGGPKYAVIYADPPWRFETWSDKGRSRCPDGREQKLLACRHYETLELSDIIATPVRDIACDDCALFLWVVDSHLDQAFQVGLAWGFAYKTVAFYWMKRTKKQKLPSFGGGLWTRKGAEQCLLFTRGAPKRLSAAVRQVIEAPVRQHSRKPDETYDRIEALVAGPYLELWARTAREGWDAWGDQVGRWSSKASWIDRSGSQLGLSL
jgi:N6-adenosine-specific RNA methylase IME4